MERREDEERFSLGCSAFLASEESSERLHERPLLTEAPRGTQRGAIERTLGHEPVERRVPSRKVDVREAELFDARAARLATLETSQQVTPRCTVHADEEPVERTEVVIEADGALAEPRRETSHREVLARERTAQQAGEDVRDHLVRARHRRPLVVDYNIVIVRRMRASALVAFSVALVSCDVPPISVAPEEAGAETFTPDPDWPKLPPGKAFGRVLGVAVAPDGRVWVSHSADGEARNTAPIRGATLAVLDPDTGALLAEHGAGQFQLPHAIAFDDEGLLWVTDADANRIVVLDPAGRVVRTIGAD